jgi:S-(hydroxymethyl)glutathione dehydrogenase/alcohol dehydrogenase
MDNPVSRRSILKNAAAVSGAVALGGEGLAVAATNPGDPSKVAGRKYRAYVRRGGKGAIEQVTLLGLGPRQVLVRTQAAQCSYSIGPQVLGGAASDTGASDSGVRIIGNGGVGIVEAVGAQVKRVKVGDQVVVADTAQCGQCYNCLRGRADICLNSLAGPGGQALEPIGHLADGTPVHQDNNEGGLSELMVPFEERCVPVFTKVPAPELSLLSCVASCGLAATHTLGPVEPGANVVVLGAGPVGLSAIQGARIRGATQIIAVDPISARRELAKKLGATTVLDPNVEAKGLVAKIRTLCSSPFDTRVFSGGGNNGPDNVIEAVGGDQYPPKAAAGPDPTGVMSLQQAWDLCSASGHLVTVATGQRGTFSVQGTQWANGSKNHHAGNMAGANAMRDIPIYVRLVETKQFDAKSLITATFPLERAREAFQAVVDRTTVGAVIVFA